ncbi:extracellular solute-binding protein [Paenibacillus cellulositrophicus]|uniref:ABC transporter substrate-binding protein n=1 Tax=Paenibacillus cellulositrophicus TaxID=562959 RepID=UPI00203D3E92|nr:extracellular solute-binding protein [Paenibacillus cellulositrophicus]MCM3000518.1 extracellular solute-binding protein [Paenibacillus cellulositrophicus]
MKRKRIASSILSMVMLMTFTLAGCSGSNDSASPSGTGNEPAPTPAPNQPAAEEKHDPVTLKFISWKNGTYDELYDLFHQKYPWITIEQVPVTNSQPIMEIIASLEAAGTPADVTEIDSDLITFEQNNLIEDLTPYIEKSDIFKNAKFPDGFFETMMFNNKKLAVPMVDVPMWVLVNKDLLAKHGVDMPANDWSYDDFRSIAKQVTDPSAGEYGITTQPEIQMRLLSSKAIADGHAANHQYMNEDLTQSMLSTPDVMNDVKWFQELVTKDGSMQSNAAAEEGGNVTKDFINGKTAFAIGGDWVLPTLKEKATFDWDVLPFPKGKVSQPGYSIYGPLALLSGSKHKEEAFLWLSFQFTPEAQKWKIDQGANASVIDPELTSYYDQAPIWQGKNIEAVKIAQKNAKIQSGLTVPGWNDYNYNNILNDIIFGDRDINDIIPETETWNKKTQEVRATLKQ